jgi:hypothetical protein
MMTINASKPGWKPLGQPTFMPGDDWYADLYVQWHELINLTAEELQAFLRTPEGKIAGLTKEEAKQQGIHSGHESAQWILMMKRMEPEDWGQVHWDWAKRQVAFVRRMSKARGPLYDDRGKPTRKLLSLLLWGHAPPEVLERMRGGPVTVRPGRR